MIILDTNVISELMKEAPATAVLRWIDRQEVVQLFITTITIAEIMYGINALPNGKRKLQINDAFANVLQEGFKHRILSFDETAAHQYGLLMGHRKELGRPLSILDGQIAAIARAERAALATRNGRDFIECDVELMNPFE